MIHSPLRTTRYGAADLTPIVGSYRAGVALLAAALLLLAWAPAPASAQEEPASPTAESAGAAAPEPSEVAGPPLAPPPVGAASAAPGSLAAPPAQPRVIGVRRFRPAEEAREDAAETAAGADRGRSRRAPSSADAISAAGSRRARLGEKIVVQVEGLEAFLESAGGCDAIILYVEGMALNGNHARSCDIEDGEVRFTLNRDEEDDPDWHSLLGKPSSLLREVRVSVGTDDRLPLRSRAILQLVVMPGPVLLTFIVFLALGIWLFLRLARRTDMLRDRQADVPPGALRPYSLARVQMAWWFALAIAAYVFIWLVLGQLDTISESVLALIGIGSGTALGAAMIDEQKKQSERQATLGAMAAQATVPAAGGAGGSELSHALRVANLQAAAEDRQGSVKGVSRGFLQDVLSDGDGINFHRFQMLIWTLVLGVIFVASVYDTLEMPEFSATLLALMGISNGTYLGFKFPERFDGPGGAAAGVGAPPVAPLDPPGSDPADPPPADPPPADPPPGQGAPTG